MNMIPEEVIVQVSLPEQRFSPGGTLALHTQLGVLAYLERGSGESVPCLLGAALLNLDESRVLAALLSVFPKHCPYEVALAALTYPAVDEPAVARCRQRLQQARQRDYWAAELAGVRAALSSTNAKLTGFELEICAAHDTGYVLVQSPAEKGKTRLGYATDERDKEERHAKSIPS